MLITPKVAVVLLNYNGQHWLQQFLPGILSTDYPSLEVIVADNASTDESVQWIQENYPGVRTILLKENAGYAGGYNLALKDIQADYFVLLNTDVYVEPGWLLPWSLILQLALHSHGYVLITTDLCLNTPAQPADG
jgi:GT2 family glycosyltransferase